MIDFEEPVATNNKGERIAKRLKVCTNSIKSGGGSSIEIGKIFQYNTMDIFTR
jgi:hypothetical protein